MFSAFTDGHDVVDLCCRVSTVDTCVVVSLEDAGSDGAPVLWAGLLPGASLPGWSLVFGTVGVADH